MSPSVAVIDAGIGNLGNVERALRHLGAEVTRTDRAADVAAASIVVLPGVGAFRPPRERLRGPLEEALRGAVEGGAWLLGICVGYQLLFEAGEEFGETDGLGLVPGRVVQLPESVPLPHIGWNRLHDLAAHPLLEGVEEGDYAYFVHSYAPELSEEATSDVQLAACTHGRPFPAIVGGQVGRGQVFGAQFHPEKSGDIGLRLLANFLEMAHAAVARDRSA